MQLWAVRFEERDYLGRIVEEFDSVWLDRDAARARCREINTDLATYPGAVAHVARYQIMSRTKGTTPKLGTPRKLDADKVRQIRARYETGESAQSIGQAFGVSKQTVSDIVHYRIWGHVE